MKSRGSTFPYRAAGGFLIGPAFLSVVPFFIFPLLARLSDEGQWIAIGVGQGVGLVASVIVGAGFNVTGPAEVAGRGIDERVELWRESVVTRLAAFLFVSPGAYLLADSLVKDAGSTAGLMAVAISSTGLSVQWFAVAVGDSKLILTCDVIPKVSSNLIGAALAWGADELVLYPMTVLLGNLVGPLIATLAIGCGQSRTTVKSVIRRMRRNRRSVVIETVSGVYSSGAVPLFSFFGAGGAVLLFTSADRLVRLMSPAISIVGNVCRAWVASADEHSFAGRLKVAAFLHFFVGLCGMFFLILMGPWMTAVLFGAEFAVGIDVMVPIGVYFFLWSLETVTSRHMLANMGGISHLYLITLTISIPGACALLVAGRYSGAVGGAWVLASVMATLVVSQAIAACTLWGRPETSTNP